VNPERVAPLIMGVTVRIYTIGFTKKSAEQFFTMLRR